MFDWNDLTFFLEVARHGRLMPAARRLKVDHTTVGRRVSELERTLGLKLFNRTAEGFALTDAGRRLLVPAERIERDAACIAELVDDSAAVHPVGPVRVASMEGIASFYLAAKFAELAAVHAGIVVELVTERHLINLTRREADVSVSFIPPQGARLVVRHVGHFRLALYGSVGYLALRGQPRSREALHDHDFVDYIDDLIAIEPVHWLLEVLRPANVVFRSTSMAAQQTAVAAGFGLALLPLFSAKTDPALVPVLPEEVVVTRDLYVSVHADLEHAGRVRAVTRFLSGLFERDQSYLTQF